MVILITGFEPFTGVPHNPSAAAVSALSSSIDGRQIRTAILPVDTDAIESALTDLYAAHRPSAVIHCGVAEQTDRLRVETQAVNERSFRIPDNQGRRLVEQPIRVDGPKAMSTRLPVEAIVSAWTGAGLLGESSDDAGRYLCNQTMYLCLSTLSLDVPAGFIHMPPDEILGATIGRPGWPLSKLVHGLELCVRAIA